MERHPPDGASYHLQHPGILSAEWLAQAKPLLAEFVEKGLRPQDAIRLNRMRLASDQRDFHFKIRGGKPGRYEKPLRWQVTCADALTGGRENYCANVEQWAKSILTDLHTSGNW